MKCAQLKVIILLSCLPNYIRGLTIYDRNDGVSESLNEKRKDIKSTSQQTTVEGLRQPVRTGFAYNDADDVIHIIEPPQHFQEMKRRHRQNHGTPISDTKIHVQHHRPSFVRNPLPKVTATKVKDHVAVLAAAKVASPEMSERLEYRSNRRNPIAATIKRDLNGLDLNTQETRVHYENHLATETNFPLEILASVRQTDRRLKKQHQLHQQQRPLAKQRVKLQKTHTVITERGYEQARYRQGQENRVGGLKVSSVASKRIQRVRRDIENTRTADLNSDIQRTHQVTNYNIEQGSKLLARLDALIKHATWYLPDDNYTETHNHVLEELRTRFQNEFEPKQLIGEIEPTPISTTSPEREIYQILESSLNATETIMQELMRKRTDVNKTHSEKKCDAVFNPLENSLQQLQSKLDCMRSQLSSAREQTKPITTTTTTTTSPTKVSLTSRRGTKRYGERTRQKTASGTKTSTSSTLLLRERYKKQRGSKSNGASLRIDSFTEEPKITAPQKARSAAQLFDMHNVSTAAAVLLYDDVMTNIRNMLEAKNLKLSNVLPETRKSIDHTDEEVPIAIDFIDTSSSASTSKPITIDATEDFSHIRDLSRYLSELNHIVTQIPQIKRPYSSNDTDSNNSNSHNGSHNDWYLINEEGKISDTPFDVQLQPSAVIFHRFPDIPNAGVYVRNHTAFDTESSTPENAFNFF